VDELLSARRAGMSAGKTTPEMTTDIQHFRSEITNSDKEEVARREDLSRDNFKYLITTGVTLFAILIALFGAIGTLGNCYQGFKDKTIKFSEEQVETLSELQNQTVQAKIEAEKSETERAKKVKS
jgi:hypothetical protein